VVFKHLLGQLDERQTQLSPPKAATEHFAEDGMAKKSFFGAIIIIHVPLLGLFLMMPHSIFFKAGPGQSLPLWVSSGTIGPANRLTKPPEGSASTARQFCDCGPDPEEFCERGRTVPRLPGYRIAPRALLRPAAVPGRFCLRFYRRQAWLHPAADPTNPTKLEISKAAFASVGDFAIPQHPQAAQSGRQSSLPVPGECSGGTKLRRWPGLRTSAMDAANPATGSSCGRRPGTESAGSK